MLSRRNVLAQYVSHNVVANQTGTHLVRGDSSLPAVNRIEIDIKHCLDYARDIIRRRLKAEAHYVNHPVLDNYYEDLVINRGVIASKIQEFLQVSPHELATDTK